MTPPHIREARTGEERAIATFVLTSWRTAYRGMAEAWALDDLPLEEWVNDWRGYLAGPMTTLIAEDPQHGEVVGMCLLVAPSRDADEADDVAEIAMIHAHPERLREGVGRRLMDEALRRVRQGAWKEVTVWAMDGNLRAQHFYKSYGFSPDPNSEKRFDPGFHFPDIRLRLKLK